MNRKYNLKVEKTNVPDSKKLKFTHVSATALPPKIDLRSKFPSIYDQGQLGSCTANAGAAAYRFDSPNYSPSRLFLYYNERMLDGDISEDAGSSLSQCVRALEKYGVCSETTWPYLTQKFATKPTNKCYTEAKKHHVIVANQINQTMHDMKACLASGFPFILGFLVYPGFESEEAARTGIIPMPGPNDQCLGGHAVVCVGYDDQHQWWILLNSWGVDWGSYGFFYLPYAYLTNANLASDFWVLKKVTV